jgi:low affinity Fe/Cu permease
MDASSARRDEPPRSSRRSIATYFDHFAAAVTAWAGSSIAFGLAVGVVLFWAVTGPISGYSETWQLLINTGTTIVTFLMVFLIQQSQNKNDRAVHLKIDDLLIALKGADEDLVDAETLDEDRLIALASALTAHARRIARDKRRRSAEEGEPAGRKRQTSRAPRSRNDPRPDAGGRRRSAKPTAKGRSGGRLLARSKGP